MRVRGMRVFKSVDVASYCTAHLLLAKCLQLFFRYTSDERSVLIQIRVLMVLNEEIWSALDKYDHLLAAELCLFAEHIFTGVI